MLVKYLGPSDWVEVAPHGRHKKDEIKDYPEDFATDLLATSRKQHFEVTDASGNSEEATASPAGEKKSKTEGKKK